MTELFKEAIAWYNLPLTALLGLVVLYWIIAGLGVLGDSFDFEFDADVDADGDVGSHGIGDGFAALLKFVNMDKVPVMIVVSVLIISMWALAIVGNYFFTGAGSVLAAIIVLFVSFIISLFVTKAATAPVAILIRKMRETDKEAEEPIIGRSGVVRSGSISTEIGQIEVKTQGAPLLINARIREGNARLKKGDECLIIDEDEESGAYYVKAI